MSRHIWNHALGAALYPSMQALEVALRNSLHGAISSLYGVAWYDDPAVLVGGRDQQRVTDTKQRVMSRTGIKPPPTDRVVAALDFGFWTGLFDHQYETRTTPAQKILWPGLANVVFPHRVRKYRTMTDFRRRFHQIRRLRNAVGHHKAIWRGRRPDTPAGARIPLIDDHRDIIDAIGWLSQDLQAMVKAVDPFPAAFQTGFATAEADLETYFKAVGYRV